MAFIINCFGSLSPKDNKPETLTFWFVLIVESCLIVTSVAGRCWAVCTQKGHDNLKMDMQLIGG